VQCSYHIAILQEAFQVAGDRYMGSQVWNALSFEWIALDR